MMHVLAIGLGQDLVLGLESALPNHRGGATADWAITEADCRRRLDDGTHYDVAVLDVAATVAGHDVLDLFLRERPDLPLFVVADVEREAEARAAVERGAADYLLVRQESPDRLTRAMGRMLEQARNRRMVIRQTSLLKALLNVTQQIAATPELAPILEAVVREAHLHLRYEFVAAYLKEDDGRLALCAIAGLDGRVLAPNAYRIPPGYGTAGRAVLTNRAAVVEQFAGRGQTGLRPSLGLGVVMSELSVPIRDGNHAIGALTIAAQRPGQFGLEDERTLALLAEPLTASLRGIHAFQREAERAKREALLSRVASAVNSSLDVQQVLGQAVAEVGEVLKADLCALSQVDLGAGLLLTEHEYVNASLGERRSLKKPQPLGHSLKLLAHWLQTGSVLTTTEDLVDPVLQEWWQDTSTRFGLRSVAWVPIRTQIEDRFYVLMLMQVTHGRRWTEDEQTLLRGIAGQLALALRNAQLFETTQLAAAQLRAKNAELEAFVYTVSHDLQAPVVSMRGFASLLQNRHRDQFDERGALYIDRIAANAEYLSRLLNDLLELSRVGRLEEPDEVLASGDVVKAVLEDLRAALKERGVNVMMTSTWPQVRFSRVRLRQVFSNLVSNAIKFLGTQPQPRIEIGWRLQVGEPALVEFWVRDNGIGIHPDYHQRVFRPFQRLKVVEVDGTGVGLSIVRRIVEGRGGAVHVESTPGQGATFYFTAPLVAVDSSVVRPVGPEAMAEVEHVAAGITYPAG
ncbi:MAG: GAF domain-containing protein [Anaerolineales bacterium]|nr:GAF domain-containing protein [Anaerolineales bacterium]